MDDKKRRMVDYGDSTYSGRPRNTRNRAARTPGAVPPTYKIPAGKDIMLKDILYRINNRQYLDMFADREWLEHRLTELSYHRANSSYEGTDYSFEKGRKVHTKITKEQLEDKVRCMIEELDEKIYNHTMPVQVVSEATNVIGDKEITEEEQRDCSEALGKVIKFLNSEEAPDIYYMEPRFNPKTGDYDRYPVKKEEVLEVAMDIKLQLDDALKQIAKVDNYDDEEWGK